MQKFLSDLPDIVRLKFRAVEYYRYSAAVTAAALMILGIVNAGMASSYLGASAGVTVAYMTLICTARWVSLTVTMQFFLPAVGAPKMQLGGFILLSEFLAVPLILALYSPLLALAAVFWQIWAFWVQLRGLRTFSQVDYLRLIAGYLLSYLLLVLLMIPVTQVFIANQWIDPDFMLEYWQKMQESAAP